MQENSDFAAKNNVKVVQIDYANVGAAAKVLDEHNVHTVISALCIVTKEHSDAQVNLVHAAAASGTVKRFVPSEYGSNYEEKYAVISFLCYVVSLASQSRGDTSSYALILHNLV